MKRKTDQFPQIMTILSAIVAWDVINQELLMKLKAKTILKRFFYRL